MDSIMDSMARPAEGDEALASATSRRMSVRPLLPGSPAMLSCRGLFPLADDLHSQAAPEISRNDRVHLRSNCESQWQTVDLIPRVEMLERRMQAQRRQASSEPQARLAPAPSPRQET
eukprot:5832304-Pleurochrysis_carterae.AAC.1